MLSLYFLWGWALHRVLKVVLWPPRTWHDVYPTQINKIKTKIYMQSSGFYCIHKQVQLLCKVNTHSPYSPTPTFDAPFLSLTLLWEPHVNGVSQSLACVNGFFKLTSDFKGTPMLCPISELHSFLWLNTIPCCLFVWTGHVFFPWHLMDIWATPTFWRLWISVFALRVDIFFHF